MSSLEEKQAEAYADLLSLKKEFFAAHVFERNATQWPLTKTTKIATSSGEIVHFVEPNFDNSYDIPEALEAEIPKHYSKFKRTTNRSEHINECDDAVIMFVPPTMSDGKVLMHLVSYVPKRLMRHMISNSRQI